MVEVLDKKKEANKHKEEAMEMYEDWLTDEVDIKSDKSELLEIVSDELEDCEGDRVRYTRCVHCGERIRLSEFHDEYEGECMMLIKYRCGECGGINVVFYKMVKTAGATTNSDYRDMEVNLEWDDDTTYSDNNRYVRWRDYG